jgi:hypothetical protein
MGVRRAAGLLLLSTLLAGARTATAVSVAVSAELAGVAGGGGPVDTVVRFTAQAAGGASGTAAKRVEIALAAPGRATVDLDPAVASWRIQGAARGALGAASAVRAKRRTGALSPAERRARGLRSVRERRRRAAAAPGVAGRWAVCRGGVAPGSELLLRVPAAAR